MSTSEIRCSSSKFKLFAILLMILGCSIENAHSKVLELSDRFVPLRNDGMWLIKFYAPWCGHCKKLEPIFKHVGQSLALEPIRVGRIDCTRFPSVAQEFSIKGFPTILFLKDNNVFTYEGDRTREDIVNFAKRLMGPPVKEVNSLPELREVIQSRDINFVYIGEDSDLDSDIYNSYEQTAIKYQQHEFFYRVSPSIAEKVTNIAKESDVVRVFKDGTSFKFKAPKEISADRNVKPKVQALKDGDREDDTVLDKPETLPSKEEVDQEVKQFGLLQDALKTWVAQERFPLYVKVTRGKFNHVLSTGKHVVIAVLEENKIGELTDEMLEFQDMIKDVAEKNRDRYSPHFQFGWTGTPELANSVAMDSLSIPNLLVVNSSSYQHYLPDDDPNQMTPSAVEMFLDSILEGNAKVYGGSTYTVRLYRAFYEAKSNIFEMWKGNPALTAVLFGLPLGFFSLICYSICCADIMDAEEEDEEQTEVDQLQESHEKTD